MASWRKHFKIWDPQAEQTNSGPRGSSGSTAKFASWLQDVYTGQPNRVERYSQYDQMDQDSEINAALDTIAEFCTQSEADTNLPFEVKWKSSPTESESKVIAETLKNGVRSIAGIKKYSVHLDRPSSMAITFSCATLKLLNCTGSTQVMSNEQ